MHISHLLFLSNLFSSDMIIIVFVALLLFGGEKLPEIARGLGKGIRDFKDASEGVKREINMQINNFEEKREEEKRMEEIAAAQNQPTADPEPLVESRQPENTIPVSDDIFIEDPHAPSAPQTGDESEINVGSHTGEEAATKGSVKHL
jgi:sec-independent protein translocase protein TatA